MIKLLFIPFLWFMMILSWILSSIAQILRIRSWRRSKTKRIAFFPMFFPGNAGYEYRVDRWAQMFQENGYQVRQFHLFNESTFKRLTAKSHMTLFLIRAILIRFFQVFTAMSSDIIVVRRSLVPYLHYGNAFLEKLLLTLHPVVILDYDDDLTNNVTIEDEIGIYGRLLFENKMVFYKTLDMYPFLIAGSTYLKNIALNKGSNENQILVLPTCVDYEKEPAKDYKNTQEPFIIGWVGSDGNQIYLPSVIEALNQLNEEHRIQLNIISGKAFEVENAKYKIVNKAWSMESQVNDIREFDFGIMPLFDDKMTRAKCGFKLIQYMDLGVIPIASAVTTNTEIIKHGENGYLVKGKEDWYQVIKEAVNDKARFSTLSNNARETVKDHYSFSANYKAFEEFMLKCAG